MPLHLHSGKTMKKIHVALLFGLLLICACSPDRQLESFFLQADSLLEEQPDSALRLLRALPSSRELSSRESARYALLLARATDKCEKSLLPCDSLLDIALHHYDDNEKEQAVAPVSYTHLDVYKRQG